MELEKVENLGNNKVETFQQLLKSKDEVIKLRSWDWLVVDSSQHGGKDQGKVEEELVTFNYKPHREIKCV